jgi:hypothetical protein
LKAPGFVWFLINGIIVFLSACEELPCVDRKIPTLQIAFFRDSASTLRPGKVQFRSLSVQFGREVYTSENPPLSAGNKSPASRISIPLTPSSDSLLLIISDSLFRDSLFLDFRKEKLFLSPSCGYFPAKEDLKIRYFRSKRFSAARLIRTIADTNSKADHVQIVY